MKALGILLTAALAARLGAAQNDLGSADVLFPLLQDPVGARSIGLGTAFEAVAEGAEAALYNPASAAFARGLEGAAHHDAWLAQTSRESLQLTTPVGRGGLSGYGSYVAYPEIELRDARGSLSGSERPNDWGVGLAGGYRFWPGLALGAGAQMMRQNLPGLSQRGFNVDLGVLAKPTEALSLALVVRNRPLSDAQETRRAFRSSLGAAFRLGQRNPFLAALSVALDAEAPAQLHAGLEQSFGPAALRAGYTAFFPSYSLGQAHGLALGAGAKWGSLGLDYACQFFGNFGLTQQISLTWAAPMEAAPPAKAAPPLPPVLSSPPPTPLPTPELVPLPLLVEAPALQPRTELLVLSKKDLEGQAFEEAGAWQEAMRAYGEALDEDGDDLAAWMGIARVGRLLGREAVAQNAEEQVQRLKSLKDQSPGQAETSDIK